MNHTEPWDIVIGKVATVFGVKGELKIHPLTDFPNRFSLLKEVCLRKGTDELYYEIEKVRYGKDIVFLKLKTIDDRSAAEYLRGYEVAIPLSQRAELPKDHFYVEDLIGMEVVNLQGDSLGTICEILQSSANDVYVTESAMIPALHQIVKKVDLDNRKMWVNEVEGLRI